MHKYLGHSHALALEMNICVQPGQKRCWQSTDTLPLLLCLSKIPLAMSVYVSVYMAWTVAEAPRGVLIAMMHREQLRLNPAEKPSRPVLCFGLLLPKGCSSKVPIPWVRSHLPSQVPQEAVTLGGRFLFFFLGLHIPKVQLQLQYTSLDCRF